MRKGPTSHLPLHDNSDRRRQTPPRSHQQKSLTGFLLHDNDNDNRRRQTPPRSHQQKSLAGFLMARKASTKSKSRPSSYAPAQIQTCPAIVACAFGPSLLVPHSEKCTYVARALAHTPLLLLELARATLLPVSVVGPNCCLSMMTKQRHECSDKIERSPAPGGRHGGRTHRRLAS